MEREMFLFIFFLFILNIGSYADKSFLVGLKNANVAVQNNDKKQSIFALRVEDCVVVVSVAKEYEECIDPLSLRLLGLIPDDDDDDTTAASTTNNNIDEEPVPNTIHV